MSTATANKPKNGKTATVTVRSSSYANAEKAVALKTLNGEATNLCKLTSDAIDSVTAPILKSAGITPAKVANHKIAKARNG
jgi:hypothetical protein